MKANEQIPQSGKAARGKRHAAKPSPQKALAGGDPKPSLRGSILGRPVSMDEMLLRSEIARLQHLLRATTEALKALTDKCLGQQGWHDNVPELIRACAALAKVRGEKPESTSTAADPGR